MTDATPFEGYETFAAFIASDRELSVFKRFDRLSARNLLCMQTELLEAQARLQELDLQDYGDGGVDVQNSAKCWETFVARAEELPREHERMEVLKRVRGLIEEYRELAVMWVTSDYAGLNGCPSDEALLLQSQVLRLGRPSSRVFTVYSNWFESSKPFVGYGRHLLRDPGDFVALSADEEQDRLSSWIQYIGGKYLPGEHNASASGVKYYSERVVQRFTTAVSVVLAALLLEGAIVALYLVKDAHIRLGLLALFTCLFAGSVALLTNAKRSEMFAATAAYVAVLVVFVSGNLASREADHNTTNS